VVTIWGWPLAHAGLDVFLTGCRCSKSALKVEQDSKINERTFAFLTVGVAKLQVFLYRSLYPADLTLEMR
jgi:hypothetical protein